MVQRFSRGAFLTKLFALKSNSFYNTELTSCTLHWPYAFTDTHAPFLPSSLYEVVLECLPPPQQQLNCKQTHFLIHNALSTTREHFEWSSYSTHASVASGCQTLSPVIVHCQLLHWSMGTLSTQSELNALTATREKGSKKQPEKIHPWIIQVVLRGCPTLKLNILSGAAIPPTQA